MVSLFDWFTEKSKRGEEAKKIFRFVYDCSYRINIFVVIFYCCPMSLIVDLTTLDFFFQIFEHSLGLAFPRTKYFIVGRGSIHSFPNSLLCSALQPLSLTLQS
ncbi:hypothetical protein NH340_JMT00269 [Sarcoptes scabiei]|nr:hypothetical protein NH340_JMT00269 [Sarcoptes scabiei]